MRPERSSTSTATTTHAAGSATSWCCGSSALPPAGSWPSSTPSSRTSWCPARSGWHHRSRPSAPTATSWTWPGSPCASTGSTTAVRGRLLQGPLRSGEPPLLGYLRCPVPYHPLGGVEEAVEGEVVQLLGQSPD